MWKLVLGFLVFAALAMFLLSKGGDIDMSGEQHGIQVGPAASEVAPAASEVASSPG